MPTHTHAHTRTHTHTHTHTHESSYHRESTIFPVHHSTRTHTHLTNSREEISIVVRDTSAQPRSLLEVRWSHWVIESRLTPLPFAHAQPINKTRANYNGTRLLSTTLPNPKLDQAHPST